MSFLATRLAYAAVVRYAAGMPSASLTFNTRHATRLCSLADAMALKEGQLKRCELLLPDKLSPTAYPPCSHDNLGKPTDGECLMDFLGMPFCAVRDAAF